MAPPAAITYELPYLAAFRTAAEGAVMRARDAMLQFMEFLVEVSPWILLGLIALITAYLSALVVHPW